jgi:TfoX/Sxy family transcriptional regulator of competence genes
MPGISWKRPPPELVAHFDALAARFPETTRRKMFGNPSLFVGGNLVTGLFEDGWMVRLAEPDLAEVLASPGARAFAPMPERPMRGYALLPPDVVADDAQLDSWVRRAIEFGRTLPAKR